MLTLFLVIFFVFFLLSLCKLGKIGIYSAIIITLLSINIWLCTNVWWYPPKVEAPEINLELESNLALEPNLGENITKGADGEYYVTLVNRAFDNGIDSENTPSIHIHISPENASLKKGNYHFYINNQDLGKPQTVKASNNYAIITDYSISMKELESNQDKSEPTKYTITVTNTAGKAEKILYITYESPQIACAKYSQAHPEKDAATDIKLCQQLTEWQKSTTEKATTESINNPTSIPNTPDNTHTTTPQPSFTFNASTCVHEEAGRCWDDLEMEAYDKGRYDQSYSYYGDSYYEPDDCDELCQDILADAYEEGYYDGY